MAAFIFLTCIPFFNTKENNLRNKMQQLWLKYIHFNLKCMLKNEKVFEIISKIVIN